MTRYLASIIVFVAKETSNFYSSFWDGREVCDNVYLHKTNACYNE